MLVKHESKGRTRPSRKLPTCIALGCSIGLACGSLALGVGIGVAIGVTLDVIFRTRVFGKDNAEADNSIKE